MRGQNECDIGCAWVIESSIIYLVLLKTITAILKNQAIWNLVLKLNAIRKNFCFPSESDITNQITLPILEVRSHAMTNLNCVETSVCTTTMHKIAHHA